MQADTLKIVPKSGTNSKGRELNNLNSAFIKNEELDNLPSSRRRPSRVAELINGNETENVNTHEPVTSDATSNTKPEVIETSEAVNFQPGNDDMEDDLTKINTTQDSVQESTEKPVKRGRGRPRKIKVEDPLAPPKVKRKVGRPRKGMEVNAPQKKMIEIPRRSTRTVNNDTPNYRIEKNTDDKTKDQRRRRQTKNPNTKKPVSLSKTKISEIQKPMYINMERIITNENRDKRLRVNTLDVIKQLVENFSPEISDSSIVNEDMIHNEFKNHILHHLGYLFDAHANISDISLKINDIQKKKAYIRNQIFELKKSHASIGSELSKMRGSYQDERLKFKNFSKMTNKLHSLSNIINDSNSFDRQESKEESILEENELIDKDLFILSKIINPNAGMFKKLVHINNKLNKIDNELSY